MRNSLGVQCCRYQGEVAVLPTRKTASTGMQSLSDNFVENAAGFIRTDVEKTGKKAVESFSQLL